jgi:TolB-like protein
MTTRPPAVPALLLCAALLASACGGADGADPDTAPLQTAARGDSAAPAPAPPAPQDSFDMGVARVGARLATAGEGRTIAVLSFPDIQDRPTDLGHVVAERLTTALVRSLGPKGRVVERRQVVQVLKELDLAQREITTAGAAEVGRRLGADVVVLGTVGVLDGKAFVSARAVNVEDGSVAAADEFITRATPTVIRVSSTTSAAGAPAPAQKPLDVLLQQPVTASEAVGVVQAQAHACLRTGSVVLCGITLRAIDIDAFLNRGWGGLTATDNRGNTVGASFSIGRERPTTNEGLLAAGVATPMEVQIEGLPLTADTVARLSMKVRVSIDGRDVDEGTLTFRGLPILRQ